MMKQMKEGGCEPADHELLNQSMYFFWGILGYNMIIHDITINTPAVTNLLPPLACGWGFFVERGMDCPRLGGAVPPCFTQPRNKTITTTARPRHSGGLNQAVLMGRMELNT